MNIHTITVGMLETNAYIVEKDGVAVIVDPGDEPTRFSGLLKENRLELKAILITHGHGDHIGAVGFLREEFPQAEVICHSREAPLLTNPELNLAATVGIPLSVGPPDRTVEHGERLTIGPFRFEVRHLPGHTPGHVVFILDKHVFAGDTLFAGGVGRWDLPGGEAALLLRSIREQLMALPDETRIYPGHGPVTTVGAERDSNPYLDPSFDPGADGL